MGHDAKAFIVDQMDVPGVAGAIVLIKSDDGTLNGINHCCPCGCGSWSYMGINPKVNTQIWSVQGSEWPNVTLAPSIGIRRRQSDPGSGFHWHGYLENGIFVER